MTDSLQDLADLLQALTDEALAEGGHPKLAEERARTRLRAYLNSRALEDAIASHPAGKERA